MWWSKGCLYGALDETETVRTVPGPLNTLGTSRLETTRDRDSLLPHVEWFRGNFVSFTLALWLVTSTVMVSGPCLRPAPVEDGGGGMR